MSFLTILIQDCIGLRWYNKTRKGNKKYTNWEGRNKAVFVDDMIVYEENLKESIKKKIAGVIITRLQDTRLIYKKKFFSFQQYTSGT